MSQNASPTAVADTPGPTKPLFVLIVEHVQPDAELCVQELSKAGFEVRADVVATPEEFSERLRSTGYDVILADYRLPNWTGMGALALLQQLGKDIPILLVTGTLGEEAAVDCIKKGMTDYVLKDRLVRLPLAVRGALEEGTLRRQRARAEQALRESEARYRVVAETATDAIITINSESRILFVNSATERIFGYGRAEMLGQELTMLMPDYLREMHRAGLGHHLGTDQKHAKWEAIELTGLHKGGAEIPVEVSFGELVTDGEHTFTGIVRDISERKRAQGALQQANKELVARLTELQQQTHDVTLVNQMGDLLQTCITLEEAHTVIGQFIPKLFPAELGALCVLDTSRNLLEPVAVWGGCRLEEHLFPVGECWALRRGQVHLVEGPSSGPACGHLSLPLTASSLCVPMMAQGETLGVLLLQSGPGGPSCPPRRLTESQQRLAVNVAEHIALALANLRLRQALRNQSIRDPLTGLFNRRYLEESLERELCRAIRKQRPLGMILLDLDHFKGFNDTFGHEAGDTLLREMGHFLQGRTRREDIACRYGGEEFMLILPEAWLDVTQERAEQLREEIKRLNVHYRGQVLGAITLSLGVAVYPQHGPTASSLLRVADSALYRAKAAGRDRVFVGEAMEEKTGALLPDTLRIPPRGQPK